MSTPIAKHASPDATRPGAPAKDAPRRAWMGNRSPDPINHPGLPDDARKNSRA